MRTALTEASGLIGLIAKADRQDRQELYRALRLNVGYHKEAPTGLERVHARLELTSSGGPISALATTETMIEVRADLVIRD